MRIATRNTSDAPKMNASLIAKVPFFAKDTGHSKNPEISKTRCGASLREITACKKSCTRSDVEQKRIMRTMRIKRMYLYVSHINIFSVKEVVAATTVSEL